jgi:hypothetical protein
MHPLPDSDIDRWGGNPKLVAALGGLRRAEQTTGGVLPLRQVSGMDGQHTGRALAAIAVVVVAAATIIALVLFVAR